MKKLAFTFLCNAVLLIALCVPADARTTIGLISTAPLSGTTQANFDQLSKELGVLSGTPVKLRSFGNDAELTNWLIRFQEIDAAIVAATFIKKNPAGTLKKLADLHPQKTSFAPLVLVVRRNLASNKTETIKKAFLELGISKNGRAALNQMGLVGVTLPGEPLSQNKLVQPSPPVQAVRKQPAPVAKTKLTPKPEPTRQSPKPLTAVTKQDAVSTTATQPPQVKEKTLAATPPPVPPTTPQTSSKKAVKTAAKAPTAKPPVKKSTVVAKEQPAATIKKQPIGKTQTPPATKSEAKPQPTPKVVKAEETTVKQPANKRLTLFVALVILTAIIFKILLFVLRWKKKKESEFKPEETPAMDVTFKDEEPSSQETLTSEPDDNEENIAIEEGRLGPGKVPQLLKRCADLPKPVILHVTKGSYEKLVYFAGGQVSGALTQHSTTEDSGVRWNKLGNLLVREELITREERDQGMELLENEPGLRFGEALLKLGLIDLAGLRHALTRQAKVTIYSLILYPEGRYQIYAGNGSLPPEESISLGITSLIREASQHKSEWLAIRQALPNLNTSVEFCAEGRNKLENVKLSAQQEETLTHIDGNRTINEICIESSLMDYEVYRFLYLMVKAGVLK